MQKNKYELKNFEYLFGTPGFSDKLLTNHFKLYEGYVKNTNELSEMLASGKDLEEAKSPHFAELRRRFGWEFNGMRLHEYYFGNMGRKTTPLAYGSALSMRIADEFVSFERWQKEFTSLGAMRGIGWVMLAADNMADRLFNIWINEHDSGLLAGVTPLLVMDVFEHAYITDYGLEKEKYVVSFWNAIQWPEVENRFEAWLSCQPMAESGKRK